MELYHIIGTVAIQSVEDPIRKFKVTESVVRARTLPLLLFVYKRRVDDVFSHVEHVLGVVVSCWGCCMAMSIEYDMSCIHVLLHLFYGEISTQAFPYRFKGESIHRTFSWNIL